MRGTLALALAGVAALASAPAAGAAKAPRPRISVNVLTLSQREIVKDRVVRVEVTSERSATVRLRGLVRSSAKGSKTGDITATRELRVKKGKRTLVTLPVAAPALSLFKTCSVVKVTISARARGLLPHRATAPSRRLPPYVKCPGGTGGGPPGAPEVPRLTYSIGVASRSINPDADGRWKGEPVYLGGYGIGGGSPVVSGRAATGVLGTGPSVRALTIGDGKHTIAIGDIEVQGWFVANKDAPYGLMDIRRAVEKATGGGLRAEQVTVQSDHSHGGADPMGVWGNVPLDFRRYMFQQAVDAIVDSYRNREPANLYYGTAPGRDLLSNQFGEDPFNDTSHNDVMDSDVRVLQARTSTDKPIATILNFSAHSTVLGSSNTRITGDWEQRANLMLADQLGGKAMTIIGTFGRSQPADRGCATNPKADQKVEADAICILDSYAQRVVDRAKQAIGNATLVAGDPIVDSRSYLIQDPAENGIVYLGLGVAGSPGGAEIDRSLSPPWVQGNILGTVTQTVRIGDVLLSAVPGEIYPQIALKVRDAVPGMRGYMTAGLANDQLGYIIAPLEAYPDPVRRTFFNSRGDQVSPIGNDNYAFNVSLTLGERVTCSLLRGAGELFGKGSQYRDAYDRCGAFPNDLVFDHGMDTTFPGP
ncbi:MAG: hypothetical protein QOE06_1585 [Thermoleophilaceae bacterium]|nr:hypothetical protein [Thermoleophilaceae bacterium]